MPLQVGLNIVTLVMCIITLAVATTALLPQIKAGLVLLRDLVLWSLLACFLGFVGFYGWARLVEIKSQDTAPPGQLLDNNEESNELFDELGSMSLTERQSSSPRVSETPADTKRVSVIPGTGLNSPQNRRNSTTHRPIGQPQKLSPIRANRSDQRAEPGRIELGRTELARQRPSATAQRLAPTQPTSTKTIPLAIGREQRSP